MMAKQSTAAQNQLTKWINDAGMSEGNRKADLLRKAIELLLYQVPHLLPMFTDNILSYVNDKTTNVKKQVIAFIEELSKQHPDCLPRIVGQLRLLLIDPVIAVQKRAIQAASIVYRNSLIWICKAEADISQMQYVWEHISEIKLLILNMVDNDNEGIRTHSIKFLDEVVLLQTTGDEPDENFQLDNLPSHLAFVNRRSLEEESEHIFKLLIKFHNSQHISSVNLMSCMTSLCSLAKHRPKFMPRVIQALCDLHTTLPPTLSQSQVNSVRKHLRMLLINLVKHPSSQDMIPQLTELLKDIGMTNQEINKALPKEKRNKRIGDIKTSDQPFKKSRIDSPQTSVGSDSNSRSDFNIYDEDSVPQEVSNKTINTEDSIFEGLNNVENVVNLVTVTLLKNLPTEIPVGFANAYKPIPNAGSVVQKRNLAKLLSSFIRGDPQPVPPPVMPSAPQHMSPQVVPPQSVPAQLVSSQHVPPKPVPPPSLSEIAAKIPLLKDDKEDEKLTLKNAVAKLQESARADRLVENAVNKLMEETRQEHLKEEERRVKDKEKLVPPPTPTVPRLKNRVKLLKLQEITRPIPKEIKEKLMIQAVERILKADKEAAIGGASQIREKFITIFASSYTPEIRELVLNYILIDPVTRIDLGISWLYEEFSFMQGFNRHPVTLQPKVHEKHDQNYNQLLCALITEISERTDPAVENCKDVLLRKIFTEAPMVTDEGIEYLKHLVADEKLSLLALELLEDLCIMRPPRAHKYIASLVCHVLSENEETRNIALRSTLKIYKSGAVTVKRVIEKHAKLYLGFISLQYPPPEVIEPRHGIKLPWTDDMYKICLNLVMALLPENEDLIMEVARVYGFLSPEAKRCVLRVAEAPLREVAAKPNPEEMDTEETVSTLRPSFRALLEECPRGSETFLTRVVHILTDKAAPSEELVSRVRDLYATRVSDVRFLIPVLTGLTKKEILAALPKLIKLNPAVVKEVFNKLLGGPNSSEENVPVSPTELLVELHLIDPNKADLMFIIKATALCFSEKQIYNQEVLTLVLHRLMEEPEIPVLMMRTVLQALTLYPGMQNVVINILQRLIDKEVWLHKVAWEGWTKCCERCLPASAALLTSLPERALQTLPQGGGLMTALMEHFNSLPMQHQALLPPHILNICRYNSDPQPVPPPLQYGTGMPLEPLPPGME